MLISSIKKTLEIIKKNKSKVFLIFFLQVLLFASLSIISYKTLVPAMEHAKSAVDYYDSINITESSGTFGYLGKDPLAIYSNYSKMMYYLGYMALFVIISFLVIGSLIWSLSENLIDKKSPKQFFEYISKFAVIFLLSMLIVYVLIFQKLKSSLITLESSIWPLIASLLALLILAYFTFIGLSLIGKRTPKDIFKSTFRLGIFKFPHVLIIYLINIIIISLFSLLVYWTIELNMILLSITVVLLVFSFVFTRLFLIISINEIEKEIHP